MEVCSGFLKIITGAFRVLKKQRSHSAVRCNLGVVPKSHSADDTTSPLLPNLERSAVEPMLYVIQAAARQYADVN